ncbi:hypothetical protein [uncultured Massilia sp.]|uniref:hypothetical protein n=1 Tax=uncultured Massilia sp. TaxID=169973 RepID=UPI0025D1E93A|nr:hypothetical protein [uncultured Massilia sp.]
MYTMILLLYLQQNLDVSLDRAQLRGQYLRQADCEAAARDLRGPLPVPRNADAAWQDVLCVKIANNVRVNQMKPLDLAAALQAHAPLRCQAEGAWERLVALCRDPAPRRGGDEDRSAAAPRSP